MPEILTSNPTVTMYALWALTILVGFLLKRSLDKLDATIGTIVTKIGLMETKVQEQEVKLAEQITTCEVCRLSCPQRRFGDNHP